MLEKTEVILGNSNRRFSGVTSTMLQTFAIQKSKLNVMIMGSHHVPDKRDVISFWQTARICRHPLPNGKKRVFHARRNDEMIQALLLKFVFRAKINIIFTSTAQRHHSKFTKFLMKRMDAIISTCQAAAEFLENPPDQIIPHGVDTDIFQPINGDEIRLIHEKYRIEGNFLIGIFGRVRGQKGIDLFVDGCLCFFQNNSEARAVICGRITSDQQKFYQQQLIKIQAAGMSKRFYFLDEIPFKDVINLMASMSVVCALSRNEGFGLTVLEAMSCQVPVIATRAGAWPEIVRDNENGFLLETQTASELAQKISLICENSSLKSQISTYARKLIVSNYRVQQESYKLVDLYKMFL